MSKNDKSSGPRRARLPQGKFHVRPEVLASLTEDMRRPQTINLGDRIGVIRRDLKLTQAELAKRLGKSRTTVNQYETGAIDPPLKMVGELAEALEVDPVLLAFGRAPAEDGTAERLTIHGDQEGKAEFVEFSSGLADRLKLTSGNGEIVELTSDAPHFGLRKGDLLFVDVSQQVIRGDGALYAVRTTAGNLSLVRSDMQLEADAKRIKLTLGQGQISEVQTDKVQVFGAVRASLKFE